MDPSMSIGENGHFKTLISAEPVVSAPAALAPDRGLKARVDLTSRGRRALVIVLLLALDGWMGKALVSTGVSSILASSSRPERWRQGLAWNPAGPDLHL